MKTGDFKNVTVKDLGADYIVARTIDASQIPLSDEFNFMVAVKKAEESKR